MGGGGLGRGMAPMALWAGEPIVPQEVYFDTTLHMRDKQRAGLRKFLRVGLWQIQAAPTGTCR
ncbi:Hypothetical protein MexAM1_META1p2788 [Methylorubrum extorquens AM1]|uniref:Uncharacterized protein n=1 Tax=Methylorubrum extorquens (strain ATCC 14718 / DSM 1338 / JCM 2805 / NCIMB 9133 / AM1) TaxID=272630 RepID=C5ATL8_METEA|nr:Hypothetical protein MexAM1_META1p2788 [Methylorubrum extorquens AM1]